MLLVICEHDQVALSPKHSVGNRACSVFGEPVLITNSEEKFVHIFFFTHFNQHLTINKIVATHTYLAKKILTYVCCNDTQVYAPMASCSRKRPALATTTFSNFRGDRLRELRLHIPRPSKSP